MSKNFNSLLLFCLTVIVGCTSNTNDTDEATQLRQFFDKMESQLYPLPSIANNNATEERLKEKQREELKKLLTAMMNQIDPIDLMPKPLLKLVFGTVRPEKEIIWKRLSNIRKDGNDSYSCVNKCQLIHGNETELIHCNHFDDFNACLGKCRAAFPSSAYPSFIHAEAKKLHETLCKGGRSMQQIKVEIGAKARQCTSKLTNNNNSIRIVRQALDCYLELEESRNDKETCHALKYCAVDSIFHQLGHNCDRDLLRVAKLGTIAMLTVLSDGQLVGKCPILYSVQH